MKSLLVVWLVLLSVHSSLSLAQTDTLSMTNEDQESKLLGDYYIQKEFTVAFKQVNSGIFRGARPDSLEEQRFIHNRGIKTIINLQGGDLQNKYGRLLPWSQPGENPDFIENERKTAILLGMSYLHSPLGSLEPVSDIEDRTIDATLEFINDKTNQPLYIHCETGADRTGLIVALFRVKYEGVDVESARNEWINNGHNIFHRMFTGDLDKYYYKKVKEFNR